MSKLRETYKAIQLINSDARVMALSFPGGEPDLDNEDILDWNVFDEENEHN